MQTRTRRTIARGRRFVADRGAALRLSLQFALAATAVGGCVAPSTRQLQTPARATDQQATASRSESQPPGLLDTASAAEDSGNPEPALNDFGRPSELGGPQEFGRLPGTPVAAISQVVQAQQVVFDPSQPAESSPDDASLNDAGSGGEQELLPVPPGAAAPAPPQPVQQLIAEALQSHPRIAAARLRVAAATQQVPQARALADPMWNNTFWPIDDHALQTAGGRIAHQMALQQPVPWPEKLRAREAIASREVQIARAELEQVEREIGEAVRLAYYELWYASEAMAIVADNRALVADLITLAEARYRTGGAQQDVLRAELEAERLEDELIRLRRQREVAWADLGALLQRPLELAIEPVTELELPEDAGQLEQLIADALACNPALRSLAWQIARDRERERLACLQRYPDFQLGVGWSAVTENDALSGVANGNDNLNFTLGMSLPIWREKIDAGVRQAAANRAATSQLRDAEADMIYGTVRRLLAEAEALFQQLELYRTRIIPRTEQTLRLTTADYRGERVDFFSLIDIYQELLVYQVQVARMQASLAGTLARLDRAVGCPLELTIADPGTAAP